MSPVSVRALGLFIQFSLPPGFLPGKAGGPVQAGYQTVSEQLIAATKPDKPADEAVPVTIFRVIHDRDRHIAFLHGMSTYFTVGTA
jgi:hypothetical protein